MEIDELDVRALGLAVEFPFFFEELSVLVMYSCFFLHLNFVSDGSCRRCSGSEFSWNT